LAKALASLAAVRLSTAAARVLGADAPSQTGSARGKILARKLGKTGIELPIVSLGAMNTGSPGLLRRAYELGVRHFDTAARYAEGNNERMVGALVKELGVRDQVVVATKVGFPQIERAQRGASAADVKQLFVRATEESLVRLQMDHVDILYSHGVDEVDWLRNAGVLEALAQLKKAGRTRFVGVSTHATTACIAEATKLGVHDVILTSFNVAYHDDAPLAKALSDAAAAGIGIIAMKTQCSYYNRDRLPAPMQERLRGQLSQSALLKWVLRHPVITTAVPGCTSFEQLEEDFAVAYGLDYTPQEQEFLKSRAIAHSRGFCLQCGQCRATCPAGVGIPTLMRVHMYATSYSNVLQARATLAELPAGSGLERCAVCPVCRAVCPRGIPIAHRIGELRSAFA
jgi:aryl-alcohol dehydrogenase-like predicted oxidoreductase